MLIKNIRTKAKQATVIVDDEPIAVSILVNYVARHPNLILLESFTKPDKALEFLQENSSIPFLPHIL